MTIFCVHTLIYICQKLNILFFERLLEFKFYFFALFRFLSYQIVYKIICMRQYKPPLKKTSIKPLGPVFSLEKPGLLPILPPTDISLR